MSSYLLRGLARVNHSLERSVRYERRGSSRICFFLDRVVVIARDGLALFVRVLDRKPARLVSEEDVSDLLHQSRVLSRFTVGWIKNDQLSPVRQSVRRGSSRPHLFSAPEEMFLRLLR